MIRKIKIPTPPKEKDILTVNDLVKFLACLPGDMKIVGHNLNDLFSAKELTKKNLQVNYYLKHSTQRKLYCVANGDRPLQEIIDTYKLTHKDVQVYLHIG